MTPLLQEQHRLPIKFRPQYKIATFVYRFFDGSLPGYLSQTLCAYEPTRNLRSSCEKLLKVPKCSIKTFGEHSFSFLAPSVWNSLPSNLRNSSTLPLFKSRLKTHSFTTAFCQKDLCSLQPPPSSPPPPTSPTPTITPCINVLSECFSCFTVVKRVRVRENAGSGRDGGWGEREYVCM